MMRDGVYYFRVRVPKDVVCRFGRSFAIASMRTQDLRVAKARLPHYIVSAEKEFDSLREKPSYLNSELNPVSRKQSFAEIAAEHAALVIATTLDERATFYEKAVSNPQSLWHGELVTLPRPEDFDQDPEAYSYFDHLAAEGDIEAVIGYLNRFKIRQRIRQLDKMSAVGNLSGFLELATEKLPGLEAKDARSLARLLLSAEATALKTLQAGQNEVISVDVETWHGTPISTPDQGSPSRPKASPLSLDNLWQRWDLEKKISASTRSTWGGYRKRLKEYLGIKAADLHQVTAEDVVAWKDHLVAQGLAGKTINGGYLAFLNSLIGFAVTNRLLSVNVADGIRAEDRARAGTKQLPYKNDEVKRLLALALASDHPAQKWLPWLIASTGARIGEMSQLWGSFIALEDGIHVINIRPAPDSGSLKNEGSERTVPLHPRLIELGFLEFVASKGAGPLFYKTTSGDPSKKHASKGVTNRLAEWIRSMGFDDERKAPNHAFRHWFKTECSRLKIPDSVIDAMQGHEDGRASSGYRHIGTDTMMDAILQISVFNEVGD